MTEHDRAWWTAVPKRLPPPYQTRPPVWRTRLALVFWILIVVALVCWPAAFLLAAERPTATPAATANEWLTDPDNALAQLVALAQTLAKTVGTWSLTAKILGALGVAVAILRVTPVWGPIAGTAWDLFMATRKDKSLEREISVQSEGFKVLVRTIEDMPKNSTLGDLRDRLFRKMPERVREAVDSYLDENGRTLHMASGVDTIHVTGQQPTVVATVSHDGSLPVAPTPPKA